MPNETLDKTEANRAAALGERSFVVAPDASPFRCVRLNPGFAPLISEAPPTAMGVPSMISAPEKRFLYGLAKHYYRGEGIIVDAGIFLGASTRCFDDGLRENPHLAKGRAIKDRPIVSFEKGIAFSTAIPLFKQYRVPFDIKDRDSFAPAIQHYLEPAKDLVDLRIGDIMQTAEDLDLPIEICFLDVLKRPEIGAYCVDKFFPKLIPGRSIVVQQDYFFPGLPYIKTDQEFLRSHFVYIGEIWATAAFLCTSKIPQSEIEALRRGLGAEEQVRLASIAMQRTTDPARRFMMAVSKLRVVREELGREAARDCLRQIISDFPEQIENQRIERFQDILRSARALVE